MNVNLWRNRGAEPSDAEIERDVADLKRLLDGVDGPAEPHPAYWQNFVVRVQSRIDEGGFRQKRRSFSTAWASVSAVAAVTVVVVVSGLLNRETLVTTPETKEPVAAAHSGSSSAPADLNVAYSSTETESIILSGEEVKMINAIVSNQDDDAVFEAMVEGEQL